MNLIDQIELDVLTDTGDADLAEAVGLAVTYTLDSITVLLLAGDEANLAAMRAAYRL